MREIKFRAWDSVEHVMCFDLHIRFNGRLSVNKPAHYTVMQYTGLYDENKTEACDGDIVKIVPKRFITEGFIGKVIVDVSSGTYVFGKVKENEMSNDWGLLNNYHFEIIGNIHENKESLDEIN